MLDEDMVVTARLLAAVMAAQEAFAVAARSAGATGFATEFAQRAEYQERIACRMRGVQPPVRLASDALWRVPDMATAHSSAAKQPRVLFDSCLRVLDAATMELCRGYSPTVALVLTDAMRVAQPIDTTRHCRSPNGLESKLTDRGQPN